MRVSIQTMRRVFDFPATEDTPACRVTFTVDTTIFRVTDDDPNATTDGFFRGRKLNPNYMLDSTFYASVDSTDSDGTEWRHDMVDFALDAFDQEITQNRLRKRTIERLAAVSEENAAYAASYAFRQHDRDRRAAERAEKKKEI